MKLITYGEPITEVNSRIKDKQGKWNLISSFWNHIETPNGPVYIFSDGTFSNTLGVSPQLYAKGLTGLNMMLPIEYNPDFDSESMAQTVNNSAANEPAAKDSPKINNQTNSEAILDKIFANFDKQLDIFPQEKLYLHTDKPYYLAGEKIWFRAHVVDAATHLPEFSSHCVFVELFNAKDSAICRVKTSLENDSLNSQFSTLNSQFFSGYLLIPEDAPEGDYLIRACTNLMRNLDEDYFFMKTVRIANPATRLIRAFPEFGFSEDNRTVNAGIRFSGVRSSSPVNPEPVSIGINNEKPVNVKSVDGMSNFSFTLSAIEKQRTMLLDAVYDRQPYRKFIRIPLPDSDFEVSFYPEGGNALAGCMGRIAVKAMQRDGTEIEVNGTVFDSREKEITRFKTDLRGMGLFSLTPVQGEKYYAVCTNSKGQAKRFDLPEVRDEGYALSAVWLRDNLVVSVQCSKSLIKNDTLYTVLHTRGMVQDIRILKNPGEKLAFPKDLFPSGVSNILLLTKDMIPVSERLVFVDNGDYANVECRTDKESCSVRSPVEFSVTLTDESGEPLSGSLSVSVTDDYAVRVDTSSNILTFLLLSSDLRGNIPDPAFYLQKTAQSAAALELLMLTQGWRRYDTERILRNDCLYPDSLFETGYEITGTVERIPATPLQRAVPEINASVSILALNGGDYFGSTVTDSNGRFYLHDGGMPDSIRFLVQATPKSGNSNFVELTLDRPKFPERTVPAISSATLDEEQFSDYAGKAERQYVNEHGERFIMLDEVIITAQRKSLVRRSKYYSMPDRTFNGDELYNGLAFSSKFALDEGYRPPSGVCSILYLVDDIVVGSINWLEIEDVVQIDWLTSQRNLIPFGEAGRCGVLSIFTKVGDGKFNRNRKMPNLRSIVPLGFQKPVEFYAPKYGSPEDFSKPDLRTTIHWQPNLTIDETGTAKFSFHTADSPSTYSVVIEGVADDGKIIYRRGELRVKN